MRIVCDQPHHDAGEGVCVFCVNDRVRKAVQAERDAILSYLGRVEEAQVQHAEKRVTEGGTGPMVYDRLMAKAGIIRQAANKIREGGHI